MPHNADVASAHFAMHWGRSKVSTVGGSTHTSITTSFVAVALKRFVHEMRKGWLEPGPSSF